MHLLFLDESGQLEQVFPLESGQRGALLALGDALCPDWVSRPDAFQHLWPKLRRGYLLDALKVLDGPMTPATTIGSFIKTVGVAAASRQPSAGLGNDARLRSEDAVGSGLEIEDELVQVSAFTSDGGAHRAFGRIARPSSRRSRLGARGGARVAGVPASPEPVYPRRPFSAARSGVGSEFGSVAPRAAELHQPMLPRRTRPSSPPGGSE